MDEDNQQPLDQSVDESQTSSPPDSAQTSPADDSLGLASETNDDQFSPGQVSDEPASTEVPAASELPPDSIPDISSESVDNASDGQSRPQASPADASSEQSSLPDSDVNSAEPTNPSEPSLPASETPAPANPQQSIINDVTPAPSGPLASPDSSTQPLDSNRPIASTEPEKKGFWSKFFGKK